jgi:hypothetical protein
MAPGWRRWPKSNEGGGGGRGGALEHDDVMGDRFEATGREVAHRGTSSMAARFGRRGGGRGGGCMDWRSRWPTCWSHGSDRLSRSSWRYLRGWRVPQACCHRGSSLGGTRGPMAWFFHEAPPRPVFGDRGMHKADYDDASRARRGGLPAAVGAAHWREEEPSGATVLCEERRAKGILPSRRSDEVAQG